MIKLRTPILDKEYKITSKPVMTITKTFPPFRGDGAVESHNYPGSDKKVEMSDKEMTKQAQKKPDSQHKQPVKKPEEKPKQPAQKQPNPNRPQIDPSQFKQADLDDPDNIDNMNSVKVMEFKLEKIQKEINSIEGRAPPKLRDKLVKLKCRKNLFDQQLGDGISVEDYIVLMKNQLDKDKKLSMYFEQENMLDKAKLVAERMPVMLKELQEAIDFASKNK